MNLNLLFLFCLLYSCYLGYGKKSLAKEKSVREGKEKAVSLKKPAASSFLSYKECMQRMKCGPSLKKKCAKECLAGNTKEEIEEHTERLKKIDQYVKEAKDKRKLSQRDDTDLSDDETETSDDDDTDTDTDDDTDTGKDNTNDKTESKNVKRHKRFIPNKKAAAFLSYNECMRRMNCGKSLKKECSEECKEGNTEEEAEEHGWLLRNIDKFVAEAKRRKAMNDLETSDTDTDTDTTTETETDTNPDTDSDDDDSDTDDDNRTDSDEESGSEECKIYNKKSKTCKRKV